MENVSWMAGAIAASTLLACGSSSGPTTDIGAESLDPAIDHGVAVNDASDAARDVGWGEECVAKYECAGPNAPECPPDYGVGEGTACTLAPTEMCCYGDFPSDMCACEGGFWACDPHWDCF
jgi:hypothetical protein